MCHQNLWKLPSKTTPLSFYAPTLRNPREYPHIPYILWNLRVVGLFFAADRNFCNGLQKTHLFCNWVHINHSRSSKVDNFCTMVLSCTVSEIRRLKGWELRIFHTRLSFGDPAPYVHFTLEFCGEVNHGETRVTGAILQWRPHDRSVTSASRFDIIVIIPDSDERSGSDGQK